MITDRRASQQCFAFDSSSDNRETEVIQSIHFWQLNHNHVRKSAHLGGQQPAGEAGSMGSASALRLIAAAVAKLSLDTTKAQCHPEKDPPRDRSGSRDGQ